MVAALIGIAGGTGSGKTTVATKLVEALPPARAIVIQPDWYYRDRSHLTNAERARINFDEPDALENDLMIQHLSSLKRGGAVNCPQYDFSTHTRRAQTRQVLPHPIVIVEGILIFSVPALREVL